MPSGSFTRGASWTAARAPPIHGCSKGSWRLQLRWGQRSKFTRSLKRRSAYSYSLKGSR
jgi:hypothetical protein